MMITLDWLDYADQIKNKNRFFPKCKKVLQFIDQIYDKRILTLKKGTKFYRSRVILLEDIKLSNDDILSGFLREGSMSPNPKISSANRANPKNISYLYVSQDEYTALSEVRPGIQSFLSLAEIEVLNDLKVFDLWVDINKQGSLSDIEKFAGNFSTTISENNKEIDYLPMQYIAEYIKTKGADGIRYISFQSQGGKNFVIFNEEKVSFIRSKVYYNKSVNYSFLDLNDESCGELVNNNKFGKLPDNFVDQIKNKIKKIQAKK